MVRVLIRRCRMACLSFVNSSTMTGRNLFPLVDFEKVNADAIQGHRGQEELERICTFLKTDQFFAQSGQLCTVAATSAALCRQYMVLSSL